MCQEIDQNAAFYTSYPRASGGLERTPCQFQVLLPHITWGWHLCFRFWRFSIFLFQSYWNPCNSSLYSYTKNQANISKHSEKNLAKFQSPRAIIRPKIIGPKRNVHLICNSSLYTHMPKIKLISQSIAKKAVTTVGLWNLAKFFSLCLEILAWFLVYEYSDELQIKFTFCSCSMIFGRIMALGLWNLAKYLVVTTLFSLMLGDIDLIFGIWVYNAWSVTHHYTLICQKSS
jgi:hypothetical protein